MRSDLPSMNRLDAPIANFGPMPPLAPLHPMDHGPLGPPDIATGVDFSSPASSLLGARLEPLLPPVAAAVPPPSLAFPDAVNETYGLSPEYLANLNIEPPLVPKVLLSNVSHN